MAAQNFFGLDMGITGIKAVQLEKSGDTHKLVAFGQIASPSRGIISDSNLDFEALSEAIKRLLHDARISAWKVAAALPESSIFTRVIEMPQLSEKELSSAIRYEAEQYIPIPLTEVQFAYQILSQPQNQTSGQAPQDAKMEVLLIAAPKKIVEKQIKILEGAGLKPIALETEILSVSRSLVGNNPYSPTTLIISIGGYATDISIVKSGSVAFTRSISTGGEALTRGVVAELGFEAAQAEEYKKTYGLLPDQMEGKIAAALRPVFEVIVNEIKKALGAYQRKQPENLVKRTVLCGGTAKLPGIVVYLAESLGTEVQIGDPWFNIQKDAKFTNQGLAEDAPLYAVACGLALKEIG